jgi:perosamine synthetase
MKKIPQMTPYLGMEEYEAIKQCFSNNWITEGPLAKELSERLLELLGCKYGVFANNGTLSLYMSLVAVGVKPGDEVLVPDFTFIASANAVYMCGATPIFVDVDKETLHLDLEDCARKITNKTTAMMPVHIYGTSCNMDDLVDFCKKNNLKMVEDAAQAIGVHWKGKHCGTFGDVGSFSFFADKTITMGEGGFVCTNDEEVYNKLLFLRNQGRIDRGSFIHPQIGYNFRITDIQAAIGLTQLNKLDYIIERKKHNFNFFKEQLADIEQVRVCEPEDGSGHVPFRVAVITEDKSDKLMEHLKENGVETRTFFYPLHKQPCFSELTQQQCSNSVYLYEHGLCLPVFPELKEEQIIYISNLIKKFYE